MENLMATSTAQRPTAPSVAENGVLQLNALISQLLIRSAFSRSFWLPLPTFLISSTPPPQLPILIPHQTHTWCLLSPQQIRQGLLEVHTFLGFPWLFKQHWRTLIVHSVSQYIFYVVPRITHRYLSQCQRFFFQVKPEVTVTHRVPLHSQLHGNACL